MKKISILFVLALVLLCTSCSQKNVITMTACPATDGTTVSIGITAFAHIDWGDGTKDKYSANSLDGEPALHVYAKAGEYKIKVKIETPCSLPNGKEFVQLRCADNSLTTLDVSGVAILHALSCEGNQLKQLDVSKNPTLAILTCYQNEMTQLDVTQNLLLEHLYCDQNQLTSLDISKNKALAVVTCRDNRISVIEPCSDGELNTVECQRNNMGADALNRLFKALPNRTDNSRTGRVSYEDNPGESSCDRSCLYDKNWI